MLLEYVQTGVYYNPHHGCRESYYSYMNVNAPLGFFEESRPNKKKYSKMSSDMESVSGLKLHRITDTDLGYLNPSQNCTLLESREHYCH